MTAFPDFGQKLDFKGPSLSARTMKAPKNWGPSLFFTSEESGLRRVPRRRFVIAEGACKARIPLSAVTINLQFAYIELTTLKLISQPFELNLFDLNF